MITTIGSLPPGRYPETGALARHFLEGRPDLFPDFYPHPAGTAQELQRAAGARRQALEAGEIAAPRDELARVLDRQNRQLGAGRETAESIRRLARPGTMAVVTGQQAGFLGGPLYTFYKALGAIRAARELNENGMEAVPVFWIAADDHDFREVQPFSFLTAGGGEIETVRLPGNENEDGLPVAARGTGNWEQAAAILRERFQGAGEPLEPFLEAYEKSDSVAQGFGRVMARLFGRYGLILADPSPREIKNLVAPLLGRFLQRLAPLEQALSAREEMLEARGYPLQVPPRQGRTGLFFLDDGGRRRAVLHQGPAETDPFVLGGLQGPAIGRERLAQLAEAEPWRFSGSALTRCLFQDFLFPTAAYVGGPGEAAYLAQSAALYPVLGLSAPAVVHRPSFTIIDQATERFLARHEVEPAAAVLRSEELRPRLLRDTADPGLFESLEEARHRLGRLLDDLEDALLPLDRTLAGPVGKIRGGCLKGLEKVERKVRSAVQRREHATFEALEHALHTLRPQGKPQERELSGLPFVCRHGTVLLDELLEAVEPCSGKHLLLAFR
jgi:bacillithiol biosynthesis cysteine-adding enzyme BshC